jgi:hypothetical protein
MAEGFSFHKAWRQSAPRQTELDCAESDPCNTLRVGEVDWPATWSHRDSIELTKKVRNIGIEMGYFEVPK